MACNVGDVITFFETSYENRDKNHHYVVLEENLGVPSKVIVIGHPDKNSIGMIFTRKRGWPVPYILEIPNPLSKLEMLIFSFQTGTID